MSVGFMVVANSYSDCEDSDQYWDESISGQGDGNGNGNHDSHIDKYGTLTPKYGMGRPDGTGTGDCDGMGDDEGSGYGYEYEMNPNITIVKRPAQSTCSQPMNLRPADKVALWVADLDNTTVFCGFVAVGIFILFMAYLFKTF